MHIIAYFRIYSVECVVCPASSCLALDRNINDWSNRLVLDDK